MKQSAASSQSVWSRMTSWDWDTIVTILIIKAVILFIGYQSYQLSLEIPITNLDQFLALWSRWDAIHYLHLAEFGYSSIGEGKYLIVFFPLYPTLVAGFNLLVNNYLISAFIVTGVASLFLGLGFKKLVLLDHSKKIAKLSVLFLFIFPTSYFLHIPYTESLFLALVVGSFVYARQKSWLVAGLLGLLACLTRINGLILLPALLFEMYDEYKETGKFNKAWLATLLTPLGFAIYLSINYFVAGNPIMFIFYQKEHWYRFFRAPWEALTESYKRIGGDKVVDAQMFGYHEMFFVVVGLIAIVVGWKYLRNSYKVWMILNWLLFISTSFVLSVPRYTLSLFPMFILMAVIAEKYRWAKILFVVWSLLYLSLFTSLFVKGWWAF